MATGGHSLRSTESRPLSGASRRMFQDQRRGLGNLDGVERLGLGLVGPAEQDQRRAVAVALEMAFHGHDLDRLVLERVQPVLVARQDLQRRHHGDHAHGHGEHDARAFRGALSGAVAQQMPGADRAHHQRRRQVGGEHGVHDAIGKGRVEDDGEPVGRHELAVCAGGVTDRRLHPAVGRQDPEGRDESADGDGQRGGEVQAAADPVHAEQHDAQEPRPRGRTPSAPRRPSAAR